MDLFIQLHLADPLPFARRWLRSENSYAHRIATEALKRREETYLEEDAMNHSEIAPKGRWKRNLD
ncbi:hypothetical protein PVK06_045041 [Gossypium arboreum]|uniref:Uncharacterized protein n=1 Tax=Gossypium arboreum TaxID=29729 RepID=A0ABR0MTA5_GOSAR|nr:hypothetical protein PVK06_045041 [Gossypium arboreum]